MGGAAILNKSARPYNKFGAALRPLSTDGGVLNIVAMGDSTGNTVDKWIYKLFEYITTIYPNYGYTYRVFNDTNQTYGLPTIIKDGPSAPRHIETGFVSGSWRLEVPDNAATSPSGDLDVRVKLNLGGSFGGACALAGKFGAAGNRTWRVELNGAANVTFGWSADGTTLIDKTSTVALSGAFLTDDIWIRCTLDVDNGASGNDVKFYTSVNDQATWVQLGATVTTAGVTSLFNSTSTTQFIGRSGGGILTSHDLSFYQMIVFASLDESAKIIDLDCSSIPNHVLATSGTTDFLDFCGNTVTLTRNANGSLVGSSMCHFLNGSVAGTVVSYAYDATRYPKLVPVIPSVSIISYSHNEGLVVSYGTLLKTLTDKLLTSNANNCIIVSTQNRKKSPASADNILYHSIRADEIAVFAETNRFILIDAFLALNADDTSSDGTHPTDFGKIKWFEEAKKVLFFSN